MGHVKGFLNWERELPEARAARLRILDYKEIYLDQPADVLTQQAGRCMDCGIPFCQQGCPLGNPIPDFNDHVYAGRYREAHLALQTTNNFPEFTGRLCPAPCESACVLSINRDPVTIEQVEKEIIERAFREGWVEPKVSGPSGRSVAIVGSGPAGLAAAAQLSSVGHKVVVFEASDRIGGLLRYGIPDFKMEKWVIDRRLALLEAQGVEFRTGVRVGKDVAFGDLLRDYDALLLAIGAARARELAVPGRELAGVFLAMDFLEAQNRIVAGAGERSPIHVEGKRVVILGGGDTGSDCLGTAHRQGAAHVTQIELLPTPPDARLPNNPWPQWPLVFRTSSSHKEGGERAFGLMTKRLSGENGRLTELEAIEVDFVGGQLVERSGTERKIEVDVLLLALGFVGPDTQALADQLHVALDARGNVASDAAYQTNVDKVYVAGDAHRGASLIVWAIAEGREAARNIDRALRRGVACLPSRGRDQAFGGR